MGRFNITLFASQVATLTTLREGMGCPGHEEIGGCRSRRRLVWEDRERDVELPNLC